MALANASVLSCDAIPDTTPATPAPTINPPPARRDDPLDWPRARNAIAKNLQHHWRMHHLDWADFQDAIQDACLFAFQLSERGIDPGLAIFKACGRVKRGQTPTYEPIYARYENHESRWWERVDTSRMPDWQSNPLSPVRSAIAGSSQASRRAAAGLPLSGRTELE